MMRTALAAAFASLALTAAAQAPQDPAALQAAQREAMAPLAYMDGTWRGPAWTLLPNGEKRTVTHTERIGPFLGGTVRVIEGRSYVDSGAVGFNALGIISFDPAKKAYNLHSYAMGHTGDFPLVRKPDGYTWEIPAGPGTTIRYEATVKDGTWVEVGDRHSGDKPPVRFFEMKLQRVGDTDWPAGNPVPPR